MGSHNALTLEEVAWRRYTWDWLGETWRRKTHQHLSFGLPGSIHTSTSAESRTDHADMMLGDTVKFEISFHLLHRETISDPKTRPVLEAAILL